MRDYYFNLKNVVCFLIYVSGLLSFSTQAVSINPGETVLLYGTTIASSPEIGGNILDHRSADFSLNIGGKTVTGSVSQRLRTLPGNINPFDGFLFDYKISAFDDQGLDLQIEGLITQNFIMDLGGVDVDYRLDETGDIFPVSASAQGAYGPIEFDFGSNPLFAGDTSRWMFVGDSHNDLVKFGGHGARILLRDATGGKYTIPFDSYLSYVPLPASLPLFMSSLIGMVWVTWQAKR